jgi:hypothetical protein
MQARQSAIPGTPRRHARAVSRVIAVMSPKKSIAVFSSRVGTIAEQQKIDGQDVHERFLEPGILQESAKPLLHRRPVTMWGGDNVALQEEAEQQPVRDKEQRHEHGQNEVGGTQLTRVEPNTGALIEGVEQIH